MTTECPSRELGEILSPAGHAYALVAPLGHGATGTTWRARRADGSEVAIKERPVSRWGSFRELERLRREAALLAELAHPGVPRLVEHFMVEDGLRSGFYLVTELVNGPTLAAELRTQRPDWRSVLRDLAAILDVLAYLHGLSPAVVHGDVKPDNIVRRAADGALVIVDFHTARNWPASSAVLRASGLAGPPHEDAGLTTAVGSPGFMAPEQLRGEVLPATDCYAAACVALALLTGRPLHTLVDDHHRLRWEEAVVLPPGVKRLFARMLEPSPKRRASDARALAHEARALAGAPVGRRRRPALVIALGALGLVAWGNARLLANDAPEAAAPENAPAASSPPVSADLAAHAPSAPAWEPTMDRLGWGACPIAGAAALELATPAFVHFPDVPGSACAARGDCIRIDEGPMAARVRDVCAESAEITTGGKYLPFTLAVAGMTGFCQAGLVSGTCLASCALRFKHIDAVSFQQRTEDVVQALRDVHGREGYARRWTDAEFGGTSGTISRRTTWFAQGWRLEVTASWRPDPPASEAPNDIDVAFWAAVHGSGTARR